MEATLPTVRGPRSVEVTHRLLVFANGMHRLLAGQSAFDERHAFDPLVLRVAAERYPRSVVAAEVATALACRFQTASCALTRLWGLGCVERAEDPDRRKRAFRLTESGLRDVHDADLWLEGVAHQALARVTDEHIAAFHELLARFEGAMREHLLTLQSLPARPRRRRTRAGGAAGPRAPR